MTIINDDDDDDDDDDESHGETDSMPNHVKAELPDLQEIPGFQDFVNHDVYTVYTS